MTEKPDLSYEFVNRAANHPGVLKQLQVVADRIKARGQGIAREEGVEMTITTRAGVRPEGRPFVDVVGDNADQEYGTAGVSKLRILGRAGEAG